MDDQKNELGCKRLWNPTGSVLERGSNPTRGKEKPTMEKGKIMVKSPKKGGKGGSG